MLPTGRELEVRQVGPPENNPRTRRRGPDGNRYGNPAVESDSFGRYWLCNRCFEAQTEEYQKW